MSNLNLKPCNNVQGFFVYYIYNQNIKYYEN